MNNGRKIILIFFYIWVLNFNVKASHDNLFQNIKSYNSKSNFQSHKAFKRSTESWSNEQQLQHFQPDDKLKTFSMGLAENLFEKLHLSDHNRHRNEKHTLTDTTINDNDNHVISQSHNKHFNKKKNFKMKNLIKNFLTKKNWKVKLNESETNKLSNSDVSSFKSDEINDVKIKSILNTVQSDEPKTLNPFAETRFNPDYYVHNLCGLWSSGRQTNNLEW